MKLQRIDNYDDSLIFLKGSNNTIYFILARNPEQDRKWELFDIRDGVKFLGRSTYRWDLLSKHVEPPFFIDSMKELDMGENEA